jgi:hypothetical protein
MKKYHFKMVKEPEFRTMKTMLTMGVPKSMVVKVSKRSWLVVSAAEKCDSLEEYKAYVNTYSRAHEKKQSLPKNQIVPEVAPTHTTESDIEQVKALLGRIIIRLDSIASHMDNQRNSATLS